MREMVEQLSVSRARMNAVIFALLWALMASAMLLESDTYRYVSIVLVVFAVVWQRDGVRRVSRDWLAIACYVWAFYTAGRFFYGVFVAGEKGTSEWLYIFPAVFPLVGVALYATRAYIFPAATLTVVVGFVALVATLNPAVIIAGERAAPLFHHNPIHAGIGSCMLFLTSVFWLLYAAETGRLRGRFKFPMVGLGVLTPILSLFGALGAHSKGAWLALVFVMALMAILALLHYAGRWRLHLLGGLLLTAVAVALISASYVEKVAGPTIEAAAKLTDDTVATEGPIASMQRAIVDPATPSSMRERLKLWSNAIELIQAAPFVGWGNEWLREWRKTTYADVGFTLIHNGYLEIMVRHGILGMAFLLVFVATAVRRINAAHRGGVISSSLTAYLYSLSFFFFCTITTNSNNRLALGESFFILGAATVFAISLAQEDRMRGEHEERLAQPV
ncbi:O-antigen ligase family protein [Shinella sp. H4-D48]|uniref:O-antigen ligase family protein n=1 Tax=Shinella sp. H4-D48 TaxID=2925841 RepID=UPI001F538324|nr:O-antigen ligase family protein [Shinella sp. H4-D48]UNK37312.1 O-antigen ligase family protein [Shinella sp. H4-D48]